MKFSCTDCNLYNQCNTNFIKPSGDNLSKIMVILYAGDRDQDFKDNLLTGDTYKKLQYLFEKAGIDITKVYFTTAIKCKPKTLTAIKKKNISYDAILAIGKGGLVPGVALAHRLNIKKFYVINAKINKKNIPYSKKQKPKFEKFDFKTIKGKKILIVDDIAGSGKTLEALVEKLKRNKIKNYHIFVVIKFDGDYRPPDNLPITYYGKVSKDWVIFPWEKGI